MCRNMALIYIGVHKSHTPQKWGVYEFYICDSILLHKQIVFALTVMVGAVAQASGSSYFMRVGSEKYGKVTKTV